MPRLERRLRLATGLIVAWAHFCYGIHYWLRVQRWYGGVQPVFFAAALLIPSLALAGFAAAGNEIWPRIEGAGGTQVFYPELGKMSAQERARLVAWREGLELAFWALLAATLLARWLRTLLGGTYQVRHATGRVITAPIGRSILEAVRDAGLPHASVCGGRARCTTCRVRVVEGLASLPPPGRAERQAPSRVEAPPNVRLACQPRPRSDVTIVPLLPASATDAPSARR